MNKHLCAGVCVNINLQHLWVKLPRSMNVGPYCMSVKFCKNCQTVPKWLCQVVAPPPRGPSSCGPAPWLSSASQHSTVVVGVQWQPSFNLHSPVTCDVEHLPTCFFSICVCSSVRWLLRSFAHFFRQVVCFLIVEI